MTRKPKQGRSSVDSPILEGHVRNKKKLVPPILGLTQTSFISTIDMIFPEIIWVGLVLETYGLREGIDVVSKRLQKLWLIDEKVNWYRFSEFAEHSGQIAAAGDDALDDVKSVFADLRLTYAWAGLDWATSSEKATDAQERVSSVIRKYWDRFEQPYLTIVATIIYSMALSGKMKFAPGTLPEIEAIVSDWGSDRSKMAAASVRACSMAFFPHDGSEKSADWCRHFWRKNYQMSSCEVG